MDSGGFYDPLSAEMLYLKTIIDVKWKNENNMKKFR